MRISRETKVRIIAYHLDHLGAKKIRRLLQEHNINHSLTGITHVINKWNTMNLIDRKKGSGNQVSQWRIQSRNQVKNLMEPRDVNVKALSIKKTAMRLNSNYSTIRRIARDDLHLKVYKKKKVHKLVVADKVKRISRATILLNKVSERKLCKVFFSDEKCFTLCAKRNPQNDRVWSSLPRKSEINKAKLLFPQQHFDKKVMVFAGVTLHGKSRLTFVENDSTIDANYYINHILPRALVDCNTQLGNGFIFMQDGAPSHTAERTQQYLQRNAPGFIKKDEWPPHFPDLNPLDYGIWHALTEKVYKNDIRDVEHLKTIITREWRNLSQRFVTRIVRQFRHRLQMVIDNEGSHIEHLLS
jgi:hypothetical protein